VNVAAAYLITQKNLSSITVFLRVMVNCSKLFPKRSAMISGSVLALLYGANRVLTPFRRDASMSTQWLGTFARSRFADTVNSV